MRNKIVNFVVMSGEQVAKLIAGLFVMTLCARYLGPQKFGAYSYALSMAAMFTPLAKLGADGITLREAGRSPGARDRFITAGFWLQLPTCLICAAFAIIFGQYGSPPKYIDATTLTLAALIILSSLGDIFYAALKGMESIKLVTTLRIVVTIAASAATYLFVKLEYNVEYFIAVRAAEAIFISIIAFSIVITSTRALRSLPDRDAIGAIISGATPIVLFGTATMIYTRVDQYMLGQMSDSRTLGSYALAARLTEVFVFLATALQGALFSAITRNYDAADVDFSIFRQKVFDIFSVIGWVCAMGALALCSFVPTIFGIEFSEAVGMMAVLALTLPLLFQRVALGSILTIQGRFWFMAALAIFGAVSNVILNLFLIPLLGGVGAALATIVALLLAGCVGALISNEDRTLATAMCRSLEPVSATLRLLREYGHRIVPVRNGS